MPELYRPFLRSTAEDVLSANPELLASWLDNQPGAWGALAGQMIITSRVAAGRPLREDERRTAWQVLWDLLCERRAQPPTTEEVNNDDC